MPRSTKIYTRTGDDGTTALGGGQRVPKDALRVQAYGAVDELNSVLGAAVATGLAPRLAQELTRVQNELFNLGAQLAFPQTRRPRRALPALEAGDVERLERLIDALSAETAPLQHFILPGGAPGAAALHVARAVCRRAERQVIALAHAEPVAQHALPYLNRLSDALFAMARYENHVRGVDEPRWEHAA